MTRSTILSGMCMLMLAACGGEDSGVAAIDSSNQLTDTSDTNDNNSSGGTNDSGAGDSNDSEIDKGSPGVAFSVRVDRDFAPANLILTLESNDLSKALAQYEKACFTGYQEGYFYHSDTAKVVKTHNSDIALHPEWGTPVEYSDSELQQCFTVHSAVASRDKDTQLITDQTQLQLTSSIQAYGHFTPGVVAYKDGYPSYPVSPKNISIVGKTLELTNYIKLDYRANGLAQSVSGEVNAETKTYSLYDGTRVYQSLVRKYIPSSQQTLVHQNNYLFQNDELIYSFGNEYEPYFHPTMIAHQDKFYIVSQNTRLEEQYHLSVIENGSRQKNEFKNCVFEPETAQNVCIHNALSARYHDNKLEYYVLGPSPLAYKLSLSVNDFQDLMVEVIDIYKDGIYSSKENLFERTDGYYTQAGEFVQPKCSDTQLRVFNVSTNEKQCLEAPEQVLHDTQSCLIENEELYCISFEYHSKKIRYKQEYISGNHQEVYGEDHRYYVQLWQAKDGQPESLVITDEWPVQPDINLKNERHLNTFDGLRVDSIEWVSGQFQINFDWLANQYKSVCGVDNQIKNCVRPTNGAYKKHYIRLSPVDSNKASLPALAPEKPLTDYKKGELVTYELQESKISTEYPYQIKVYDQDSEEIQLSNQEVTESGAKFSVNHDKAFNGTVTYAKRDGSFGVLPLTYSYGLRAPSLLGNWTRSSGNHRVALIQFDGNENNGSGYIRTWSASVPVVDGLYMAFDWESKDGVISYNYTYGIACDFIKGEWTTDNVELPEDGKVNESYQVTPAQLTLNKEGQSYSYDLTTDTETRPEAGEQCTRF